MTDPQTQFRQRIISTGLTPPEVIVSGKLHRFPGIGKHHGNKAGWCILFDDCQGGCFGDWSSDISETWQVERTRPLSQNKQAEF